MKTNFALSFLVAVFLQATFVNAQTADNKYALDLNLINNEYRGDYGNGLWDFSDRFYPGGGLTLSRYLNPSFNVGLSGSYGNYGHYIDNVDNFNLRKFDADLHLDYKFNNGYLLSEKAKLAPFVTLGLGFATYNDNFRDPAIRYIDHVKQGADFIVPVGAGLKYQISERFAMQYKYLYNFTNKDIRDENRGASYAGYQSVAGNDGFGKHVLSFVFTLGKLDKDKDGVSNGKDDCPDTPEGIIVNEQGCPMDSDNDGVADYLDKCSGTPAGAKVDSNGCPIDTDKDGVADYMDKCPDVKGVASNNGCPEKKVEAKKEEVKPVETKKEVVAPVIPQFDLIYYESSKANIQDKYYPVLNTIATYMKSNKQGNLEVNGHADSSGSLELNKKLSQERADNVKNYLINKGVESGRISAKGQGISMPAADNSTLEGRAKNRRTDFKIVK